MGERGVYCEIAHLFFHFLRWYTTTHALQVTAETDFTQSPHSVANRIYLQELNAASMELNGHVFSEDERSSISSITSSMSSISSDLSPVKQRLRSVSSESEFCVGCDQACVDNGAIVRTAILGKTWGFFFKGTSVFTPLKQF